MKIGKLSLQTARPGDLDEQLLAATGCSAAEIREHLKGPLFAGAIAAALLPFVAGEKPERHSLAEAIAAAGADTIRGQVLALYEDEAPPKGKSGGRDGKETA